MLVRGLLCRLAAAAPTTSAHDVPQLGRLIQRSLLSANAAPSSAVRVLPRAYVAALAQSRRTFATDTASATKPTKTVKTAVKKATAAKTATKKAPAKKTKKAAEKPKPKPKPKPRAKRALTEEEKQKQHMSDLKKKALKEPCSYRQLNGWHAFVKKTNVRPEALSEMQAKFKNLTPAEREHYNHLANEITAANRKEYLAWVHTYTEDQIRVANRARTQLRKLAKQAGKKSYPSHTQIIQDDRKAPGIANAFPMFVKERYASGDFKSIKNGDAIKLIAEEWRTLTEAERQKYRDEQKLLKKQQDSEVEPSSR